MIILKILAILTLIILFGFVGCAIIVSGGDDKYEQDKRVNRF